MKRLLAAILLLSHALCAQDLPGHGKFWTTETKAAFWTTTAIRAADIARTDYVLSHGGHERWLPSQDKFAVSSYIAGEQALQTFTMYQLHRTGFDVRHPRLYRVLPYFWSSSNLAGFAYSMMMFKGGGTAPVRANRFR